MVPPEETVRDHLKQLVQLMDAVFCSFLSSPDLRPRAMSHWLLPSLFAAFKPRFSHLMFMKPFFFFPHKT